MDDTDWMDLNGFFDHIFRVPINHHSNIGQDNDTMLTCIPEKI